MAILTFREFPKHGSPRSPEKFVSYPIHGKLVEPWNPSTAEGGNVWNYSNRLSWQRLERSAAMDRLERLELAATLARDVLDIPEYKVAVSRRHRG